MNFTPIFLGFLLLVAVIFVVSLNIANGGLEAAFVTLLMIMGSGLVYIYIVK